MNSEPGDSGLRIAMIGPFGMEPKGTMSARALPLAQALTERGHTVRLIIPPWDHLADSGRTYQAGGVTIQNIHVPQRFQPVTIAAELVRQANRFHPDVIHVFKPKGYSGMAAFLLALRGRPFVLDADDWEGAGGWNEIGGYPWHYRQVFALQLNLIPKLARSVTVASRELAKMIQSLGVKEDRVFYLPNGASAAKYAGWDDLEAQGAALRTRLGLGSDPVILLYTRFFEFKVERVVGVLEEVVRTVPNARLLVAGQGFFGEELDMARLVKRNGLESQVRMLGWVPAERIPAVLGAADVAIYPFDDTLVNRTKCSVKLIDLLAAGLPVVADRVGQNCEYIEDGVSGMLVKPGDVGEFARSVSVLLRDKERRIDMGREARKYLWNCFDWRVLAPRAEEAYRAAVPH